MSKKSGSSSKEIGNSSKILIFSDLSKNYWYIYKKKKEKL